MTWRPLPDEAGDDPQPLQGSLERLARDLGAPGASTVETAFSGWREIVGEALASHCRPVSIRGDTLVVVTDDAAWATQVRYMEQDMVSLMRGSRPAFGIARIEVRVRR